MQDFIEKLRNTEYWRTWWEDLYELENKFALILSKYYESYDSKPKAY